MVKKIKKNIEKDSESKADHIHAQLDDIEKENTVLQKLISSFGARLNVVKHLLNKI